MARAMEHEFIPGLAGVPVTRSAISDIDGHRGILKLRGYAIEELAEKSTYEEAAYLVLKGELPNAGQLERFEAELAAHRAVEPAILEMKDDLGRRPAAPASPGLSRRQVHARVRRLRSGVGTGGDRAHL